MQTVRTLGIEIAFEQLGEGPPLVLVHGAGEDGRAWRPQLEALSDEFTVVAWDEPGAGSSSDVPVGFGLRGYADCLAAVIEATGSPATVAGISWGGTVVLELYRRHPRVVSALILADTYAGWRGSLPEDEVRARVMAAHEQLAAPRDTRELMPGLFVGDPPAEHVQLLDELAAAVRPETMRVQVDSMATTDQRDLLPQIAVPTLLVWGADDARSPISVARAFEWAIAGSSLVVIPECGHLSNLERPTEFNRAVRDFCRTLRS